LAYAKTDQYWPEKDETDLYDNTIANTS